MATLLFTAIGSIVGGPVGGAIGALVGRQVDTAIFGGSGNAHGPRLKELSVTTSSYGTAIGRHFGRMRVPGSIIWATELKEESETSGGGKGKPKVTTYSYTASFAVALASRPIQSIGRIWADGNLLRGAGGDLKVQGDIRIYTGEGDQDPDPLIAANEGSSRCPAHRGLAYVVFEDLDLTDFYNRLPALTFEVIADTNISLQDIVGEVIEDTDADLALDGIEGFSCEGPVLDSLRQLDPVIPMETDATGESLIIGRERLQTAPIMLPEAAISVGDGEFGGRSGFARRRSPAGENPPEILRYYDLGRDYLPGLQRASGRQAPGQPRTLELAASMTANNARILVEQTKRRADWSRDTIAWRTSELNPSTAPGAIVTLPGRQGTWRVREWEWRDTGVELSLERAVPIGADEQPAGSVDPGRINPANDLIMPPTSLAAFELPWDGSGSGDTMIVVAAASSSESHWRGAALYADQGTGELISLGPSGRSRSVIGNAENPLAHANPLIADRSSSLTVELVADDMVLANATSSQLAAGANKALIGSEIIQFARAEFLGNRRWNLAGLFRGRGGTEEAVDSHLAGETFVLLDTSLVALDSASVGTAPGTEIIAIGLGDQEPVSSPIGLRGITLRPLFPVHPRMSVLSDGSLQLKWTRRARGAWLWPDGVDAPLREQSEQYLLTFGPIDLPVALWTLTEPQLTISASTQADLESALPGGEFQVRQQGSFALSDPLHIGILPTTA